MIWAPNELGFARAYVSGDVDLECNLLDVLGQLNELADPERGPGVRVGRDTKAAVAKAGGSPGSSWTSTSTAG